MSDYIWKSLNDCHTGSSHAPWDWVGSVWEAPASGLSTGVWGRGLCHFMFSWLFDGQLSFFSLSPSDGLITLCDSVQRLNAFCSDCLLNGGGMIIRRCLTDFVLLQAVEWLMKFCTWCQTKRTSGWRWEPSNYGRNVSEISLLHLLVMFCVLHQRL